MKLNGEGTACMAGGNSAENLEEVPEDNQSRGSRPKPPMSWSLLWGCGELHTAGLKYCIKTEKYLSISTIQVL